MLYEVILSYDHNKVEYCTVGEPKNIVAVVLGDSHSKALTTAIAESLKSETEGILLISANACPFILDAKFTSNKNCFNANKATFELVKKSYFGLPIFVINRTSVYIYGQSNPSRIKNGKDSPRIYFDSKYNSVTEDLLLNFEKSYKETMCALAEKNPVYVTTPIPEMLVNVPDYMVNRMLVRNDFSDYTTPINGHLLRNNFISNLNQKTKKTCGISLLFTEEYLCSSESCKGSINGRPIYFDGDHLSEFGNKLLAPMFEKALSKHL